MSTIEERLIKHIRHRAEIGLLKYEATMERTDLSPYDWLLHAHEECMDAGIYLERIDALEIDDDELQRFVDTYRRMLINACLQLEAFLLKYK